MLFIEIDWSSPNYLLLLGLLLLFGFLFGEILAKVGLPKASGYLIGGLVLNPEWSGFIPGNFINESGLAIDLSLAIITFSIGGSLTKREFKQMGRPIIAIGITQAQITFFLITLGLLPLLFFFPLENMSWYSDIIPLCILLGVLGLPTDPAAFLAVKHEMQAKGQLTDSILGIAAIDDMLTFLNFVIATHLAAFFINGNLDLTSAFGSIGYEIAVAIGLGTFFGGLLNLMTKWLKNGGESVLFILMISFILICFGAANFMEADELLSSMILGTVVVNFNIRSNKMFEMLERYTEELIFVLFFTMSGIRLDLGMVLHVSLLLLAYIFLRAVGKWGGTQIGGLIGRAPKDLRKFTTYGLVPQGGIVIGLALTLQENPHFDNIADLLLSVVIAGTIIHEIIGPVLAKYAINQMGEGKKK